MFGPAFSAEIMNNCVVKFTDVCHRTWYLNILYNSFSSINCIFPSFCGFWQWGEGCCLTLKFQQLATVPLFRSARYWIRFLSCEKLNFLLLCQGSSFTKQNVEKFECLPIILCEMKCCIYIFFIGRPLLVVSTYQILSRGSWRVAYTPPMS